MPYSFVNAEYYDLFASTTWAWDTVTASGALAAELPSDVAGLFGSLICESGGSYRQMGVRHPDSTMDITREFHTGVPAVTGMNSSKQIQLYTTHVGAAFRAYGYFKTNEAVFYTGNQNEFTQDVGQVLTYYDLASFLQDQAAQGAFVLFVSPTINTSWNFSTPPGTTSTQGSGQPYASALLPIGSAISGTYPKHVKVWQESNTVAGYVIGHFKSPFHQVRAGSTNTVVNSVINTWQTLQFTGTHNYNSECEWACLNTDPPGSTAQTAFSVRDQGHSGAGRALFHLRSPVFTGLQKLDSTGRFDSRVATLYHHAAVGYLELGGATGLERAFGRGLVRGLVRGL